VYIAQPPLYRIKKGKFEQYIKDDREYVSVMVKRASDGMVIRYGKDGGKLEGAALTKYMGQLNDYLSFFDKVQKRLRNDDVTQAFAELFAHEGKDSVRRVDFETPAKVEAMRERLTGMQKTYQFKNVGDVVMDEEHRSYSVSYTDAQGAIRTIDWALASAPESRQMLAKHAQIKEQLVAPFFIEYAAKTKAETAAEEAEEIASEEGVAESATAPGTVAEVKPSKRASKASQDPVEKKTARDVFEYVIEQGKKEYQVQRYKGLGEMTAPQLWETTMDPERRTLLQVKLEDIAACEEIFTTLMGEDVESRRKFIEENALDVKNLDI
jgi:DNA gyrase subunit B